MNTCIGMKLIILLVISFYFVKPGRASCGQRKIFTVPTITRGYAVREGEWPWHAAIYYVESKGPEYVCGGIILDHYHVMTAAHCVWAGPNHINPAILRIHFGRHSKSRITKTLQEHLASRIIINNVYKESGGAKSDIALIVLKSMVDFDNYVQPVCLPGFTSNRFFTRMGTMVGFGYNEKGELPDILQGATMPIVNPVKCLESNPTGLAAAIVEGVFCAGFQNGTGACNGDSGGGLYVEQNGLWYVIGIVSTTVAAEDSDFFSQEDYTIFTDVPHHIDWIHQYTSGIPEVNQDEIEKQNEKLKLQQWTRKLEGLSWTDEDDFMVIFLIAKEINTNLKTYYTANKDEYNTMVSKIPQQIKVMLTDRFCMKHYSDDPVYLYGVKQNMLIFQTEDLQRAKVAFRADGKRNYIGSEWKFEIAEDRSSFYIKNLYNGEYLYLTDLVIDEDDYHGSRRKLGFGSKSSASAYKWKLDPRGPSAKYLEIKNERYSKSCSLYICTRKIEENFGICCSEKFYNAFEFEAC